MINTTVTQAGYKHNVYRHDTYVIIIIQNVPLLNNYYIQLISLLIIIRHWYKSLTSLVYIYVSMRITSLVS